MDEILEAILDTGKPLLAQVAPSSDPSPLNQDLYSALFPETFRFRLETIEAKPALILIRADEGYTMPDEDNVHPDFQTDNQLPQYSSKEIRILEIFVGSGAVSRVLVSGSNEEMLCKARRRGLLDPSLEQELLSLQKINEALSRCRTPIWVPRLLGYVKHVERGHVVGLLRQWVLSSGRLGDIGMASTAQARR